MPRGASLFVQQLSPLEGAKGAARWIRANGTEKAGGLVWLPDPDRPHKTATITAPQTIYSGNAGTVLFFLQLAEATGEMSWLEDAQRGADFIKATWQEVPDFKFVVPLKNVQLDINHGLAGTAFSLVEVWKATQDRSYRDAALAITRHIVDAAEPVGAGVQWVGAPSAALGDGAIALYLLWASKAFDEPSYLKLAARAGDRILEVAERDPQGGLRWTGFPFASLGLPQQTYMPNFEFGTAGVTYVLGRLYEETKDERFLAAARAGARHLQRIATQADDAALLFYSDPGGKDIFYLGYCGGPVGTVRPFYQLYLMTREKEYLDWTERFANGIVRSGVPERQTPGLWNVVCQCCGTAGIVDLFVSLHVATRKAEYLAFAERVALQMIDGATDLDGKGLRWYQAWTRVKPAEVSAETGYMIGAAGVGSALLHLHLATQKRYRAILLPDNPFPAVAT